LGKIKKEKGWIKLNNYQSFSIFRNLESVCQVQQQKIFIIILIMSISIETVRVGKDYYLVNYGEVHEFKVTKAIGYKDFKCQDINTLEEYDLSELTAYGKGKDFEFYEIE
jgi:hypothetical protein